MRVDFYLLSESTHQANWLFACRLLEKAYHRGHRIFVICENQQDALYLDERLWTYKEDSFIPHNLQGEGPEPPPAVQIGYQQDPRGFDDILINMTTSIPDFHPKFRRLIEIISADEQAKQQARTHFREYRKLGYEIHTHNV